MFYRIFSVSRFRNFEKEFCSTRIEGERDALDIGKIGKIMLFLTGRMNNEFGAKHAIM